MNPTLPFTPTLTYEGSIRVLPPDHDLCDIANAGDYHEFTDPTCNKVVATTEAELRTEIIIEATIEARATELRRWGVAYELYCHEGDDYDNFDYATPIETGLIKLRPGAANDGKPANYRMIAN